jgi:hypothetical protein
MTVLVVPKSRPSARFCVIAISLSPIEMLARPERWPDVKIKDAFGAPMSEEGG